MNQLDQKNTVNVYDAFKFDVVKKMGLSKKPVPNVYLLNY